MKTVFNNDEIPHLWAHQTQEHARGAGSISFRDKTGYSYAMPICRHETDKHGQPCILFTTESRSVTTSRHTSQFRSAIPHGATVYNVPIVCTSDHTSNVAQLDRSLAALAKQAQKTRPGTLKAANLAEQLTRDIANRNNYALAFKVRVKPLDTAQAATLAIRLEKEAAKARRKADKLAKERAEREAIENAERLAQWLNGEDVYCPRTPFAYLRAVGDEMETSQGARVPLAHARRAVQFVAKVREQGATWQKNGETVRVGHYQIDTISPSGDVVAGCHQIAWAEIERFAKVQGWL